MKQHEDRRNFLAAAGVGVAAVLAPGWLERAFAHGAQSATSVGAALDAAVVRARAVGKPLLAILVSSAALRGERGRLWGDLLTWASDEALAHFALCEWTCLDQADFARRFRLPGAEGDTAVAAWIETDGAEIEPVLVTFPRGDPRARDIGGFDAAQLRARAERFADVLRPLIVPGEHGLERRTAQYWHSLATMSEPLPAFEEGQRPKMRAVDRHAITVYPRAADAPDRARRIALLAHAAALRLFEHDPDGARWQAEHIDSCPPCGMARVGTSERQFLEFYTDRKR